MWSFIGHGNTPPAPIPLLNTLPLPCDEPPQKRRRVKVEESLPRKRPVKNCLVDQVTPLVEKAIGNLSRDVYHLKALAIRTLTELSIDKFFRRRWDETGGYLEPKDLEEIALQARDVVQKLADGPEFRILPQLSETPESRPRRQLISSRPTVVRTKQIKRIKKPEPPISYDVPITQPRDAPELPRFVQRQPYRPRERREPKPQNRFYQITHRPYLPAAHRKAIEDGTKKPINTSRELLSQPFVYHVDFSPEEIAEIMEQIALKAKKQVPATHEELLRQVMQGRLPTISGRSERDMNAFTSDLYEGLTAGTPRVLSFSGEPVTEETKRREGQLRRTSRLSSLLMAREMEGNRGFQRTRHYLNFQNEFNTLREDDFGVVAEFTNCAGDITTGAWVSNESFLCGTTTHSDTHNQQYNRPGNLLLCSTSKGTLRSFPDHRIPRPRVEKGENSTEAMRQSQDSWLYSSVVSSDYSAENDLAYTSSFDKTVKVWKVDPKGGHMRAVATWQHTANVNFVTAAKDSSGRVATAADSQTNAVRIYTVETGNEANSPYQTFSCSRTDAEGSDKWTYFPATMQWGQAKGCQHLLLVGYSPRSLTGDDLDIPEDKRNSGEIILWDAEQGLRIPVVTASTANVFEVTWHPTLQRFLVATTPTGLQIVSHRIKTQVHIFQRDKERLGGGGYAQFQALDCYASDINELTFVPNSFVHAYVTAACTDGKVYVWDTARGDKPIHTLQHGKPAEEYLGDREKEDTGVKFTAWNTTLDRFYTGSSDGVVKVWNVRKLKKPFIRDILTAPGPIAWGGFSPDSSKLAIGDATGRCFILSMDERDVVESHFMTLPGTSRRIRRPTPLIPHPEPELDPPGTEEEDNDIYTDDELEDANIEIYTRRTYLDSKFLELTGNPVIGAVQGPRYPSTNLYRREAHLNEDPSAPLLGEFERMQKESEAASIGRRRRSMRRVKNPAPPNQRLKSMHNENISQDLDVGKLERSELDDLVRAGALLNIEEDWGFSYEEVMSSD
ncbi:long-chain acyl synthetase [Fusarium heterosporum]|uniref:Long-chain acyl synthetase n=1 Tax=Fusarium heterosporum TaxID=42747 RepID=A0A8H5TM50_FUSHE|nr:long-chain acyl synthetase [Fusarium heterosporum]